MRQPSYIFRSGMIRNDAKFRVCTFSSFERVKIEKAVKHKVACCVVNTPKIKIHSGLRIMLLIFLQRVIYDVFTASIL